MIRGDRPASGNGGGRTLLVGCEVLTDYPTWKTSRLSSTRKRTTFPATLPPAAVSLNSRKETFAGLREENHRWHSGDFRIRPGGREQQQGPTTRRASGRGLAPDRRSRNSTNKDFTHLRRREEREGESNRGRLRRTTYQVIGIATPDVLTKINLELRGPPRRH